MIGFSLITKLYLKEYAAELEALKKQYKEEQVSKTKLQEEMAKLKKHYDEQVASVSQSENFCNA